MRQRTHRGRGLRRNRSDRRGCRGSGRRRVSAQLVGSGSSGGRGRGSSSAGGRSAGWWRRSRYGLDRRSSLTLGRLSLGRGSLRLIARIRSCTFRWCGSLIAVRSLAIGFLRRINHRNYTNLGRIRRGIGNTLGYRQLVLVAWSSEVFVRSWGLYRCDQLRIEPGVDGLLPTSPNLSHPGMPRRLWRDRNRTAGQHQCSHDRFLPREETWAILLFRLFMPIRDIGKKLCFLLLLVGVVLRRS